MINRDIFDSLFVLEVASNHLGSRDRALEIVHQHSRVVRFNNVRAAIKLQFRDVDNFVHKDFRNRLDIRYIKRITETKMSNDYAPLHTPEKNVLLISKHLQQFKTHFCLLRALLLPGNNVTDVPNHLRLSHLPPNQFTT